MRSCKKKTKWGRCRQPSTESGLCSAHYHWRLSDVTPDPYYEEKIVLGITRPTWDWMTDVEAHALINGRNRGDGRRIDQWTLEEGPMEIDTEAFGG